MTHDRKPEPRPLRESEDKKGERSSNVRLNTDEPRRRPDEVNKSRDDSSRGGEK